MAYIPPVGIKSDIEQQDESTTAGTIYGGWAPIGSATSASVWKIIKVVKSGTSLTTYRADGNDNYDNIWDDRQLLSYS